jgi:hypothetical protein
VTYWLLVRGRGEKPLDRRVDAARIRTQGSSKRPSVQPGDRAILYASVWQAIYGVADIVGEPEHDPSRSRWAWSYPIRSVTVVTDLNRAPPVEAAGSSRRASGDTLTSVSPRSSSSRHGS